MSAPRIRVGLVGWGLAGRFLHAPFIVASKEVPFFFAWRPASYPRETGFAWMTNNPKPSNQRSNGMMQISLSMGGVSL